MTTYNATHPQAKAVDPARWVWVFPSAPSKSVTTAQSLCRKRADWRNRVQWWTDFIILEHLRCEFFLSETDALRFWSGMAKCKGT